jgi:hypothetical protein
MINTTKSFNLTILKNGQLKLDKNIFQLVGLNRKAQLNLRRKQQAKDLSVCILLKLKSLSFVKLKTPIVICQRYAGVADYAYSQKILSKLLIF